MCGIVGYVGDKQAAPILLAGLSKLEYRGYDSAGLAVRDGEELAEVVKATGKLVNLSDKTDGGKALPAAVVSDIRDGQRMVSRPKQMHIRMYPVIVPVLLPVLWNQRS